MVDTKGIRAGRAFVELFADDSRLVRGLKSAERKLKAWGAGIRDVGRKMAEVGAAIITPLLASAKVYGSVGDNLIHMSERTGIAVEALSELSFAADQCGVEAETFENGIRKMQKTIVQAAKGSSSAQESLGMLGLTIKDLNGLSPDEQFKRIAERLNQIEDPTIRAAMAMEIFGKNGTAMLPMIAAGSAGIDDLCKQARALGLTISTEDAEAAHGFNRALEALWKVLKQSVFVIGSALAPTLKELAGWITGVVVRASAWIKQNKDLVLTVFKVAAAVLGGGLALVGLGYVISGLGAVFGTLATIISGVGTALGIVGSIIAWLLSPIGMVIAAVVALGGYILYATGMGGQGTGLARGAVG